MYAKKEGIREREKEKQPESCSIPVHQPVNAELTDVLQRVETLEKDSKKRNKDQGVIQVPLFLHACCAGDPTPTTEEIERYITIPKFWTKHPAFTFAVRAIGDSMIGAGIESGDIVIADQKAPVRDRCIVIASINGTQAIKRIHLQGGAIILAPENTTYQPITLQETDELQILGIVLGIWRVLYDLS
jgi:DNA polymerase V